MPSPAALSQWATEQSRSAAAHFNDPDALYEEQIRLHTAESRQSIPVVQRLLAGELDAAGAAAALADVCAARLRRANENEGAQAPLGPWLVICRAIEHFAGEAAARARLAEMLLALARIDVRDPAGRPVRSAEGRWAFWSELPGWNLAFRDHLTGVPDNASYEDTGDAIARWQRRFDNANRFQAHWLAHVSAAEGGPPAQRAYAASLALQHLREALETTADEAASLVGQRRAERYVVGVLPWFADAGAALLRLCRAGHGRRPGVAARPPPALDAGVAGYAFAGDDGFHPERWDFWKAALRRVAATDGLDPDVARRAAAAADEMDRLEALEEKAGP